MPPVQLGNHPATALRRISSRLANANLLQLFSSVGPFLAGQSESSCLTGLGLQSVTGLWPRSLFPRDDDAHVGLHIHPPGAFIHDLPARLIKNEQRTWDLVKRSVCVRRAGPESRTRHRGPVLANAPL
jgi:hypothetical protein